MGTSRRAPFGARAFLFFLLVTLVVLGLVPAVASAAITLVGTTTGTSVTQQTSPASMTVTAPAGNVGDYLVAQFTFSGGSNDTITGPTGWTLLVRTNNGTSIGEAIYYRTADGTGGDNATFSFTRSTGTGIYLRISGGILRYRGVDTSITPIYASNSGTGTTLTATRVTTTTANSQVISFFGFNALRTLAYPTGITGRYALPGATDAGVGGPGIMVADQNQATAGRGTSRTTTGVNGTAWVTHTVALTPRSVGFGGQSTGSASATCLTVTAPAGSVGDFLLAQFTFTGGSNVTIASNPSGWTLLNRTNNGTTVGQAVYYRTADGTAGDNATLTLSASARISGGILRYPGVDTSAAPVYTTRTGTSTTLTANNVTTTVVNTRVVALFGINAARTLTYPTGITGRYQIPGPTGGPGIMTADELKASAGTTTSRTTTGISGTGWVTHRVALRPDTTVPVTASVTSPTDGGSYRTATVPAAFLGSAADNTGGSGLATNSGTFTLRRSSDGYYWTGSAWQAAARSLAATNAATAGTTAGTWTSAATLPAWGSYADGTYTVQATAVDKIGNSFTGTAISFTIDNTAPSSATVTTPAGGSLYRAATVPAAFAGSAADNVNGSGLVANSTTFTLRRGSDGYYWTGLVWQVTAANLAATNSATTGSAAAAWTSSATMPVWGSQSDGTYTVQATAADKVGNTYTGTAVSFTLDNTAPISATVATPAGGSLYRAASVPAAFSGSAADTVNGSGLAANGATFTLRNPSGQYWTGSAWQVAAANLAATNSATTGGTAAAWTSPATLPAWSSYADGAYTVQATAADKVGNTYTGTASSFTLDNTAPTNGSIAINGGAGYANSVSVTLSLAATDATSSVAQMQFSTDGSSYTGAVAYATSSPFTLPAGDGLKTVFVRFIDAAGNVSAAYSDTIVLDTAPPTGGSIAINGSVANTTSRNVTLTLSASIDANRMQFSDDGVTYGTPVAYATSAAYTLSGGDGLKRVYVRFIDAADNVSAPVSSTITLDMTAPVNGSIAINGGAPRTKNLSVTLTLSASDATTGVARMQLSNDGSTYGTPVAYTTSLAYSLPTGDGSKTVYVKFIDGAGNVSAAVSAAIVLDTTAPVITAPDIVVPATGFTTPVTLSASATDASPASPAVTYRIGATPITSGYAFPLGATTVTVEATDATGNLTSQTFVVTVNKRVMDVTAVADSRTYDGGTGSTGAPTVTGDGPALSDTATYGQSFASKDVGAGKTLTPTVTIVSGGTPYSGPWPGYYVVTTHGATTGTITAAALDITAAGETKVYDGDTDSSGTPAVSGLKGSDTVTGLAQAFDSKDVLGTDGSTLQVTDYTVNDGNAGGNYTVATHPATGTVTPAPLDIEAVSDARVYDGTVSSGTAPTADPTDSQLQGDDTVDGLVQEFASKNVLGTGGSTLQVTAFTINDGNSGNDYTVTTHAASGTITKAGLTVTATGQNRTYDRTTAATVTLASDKIAGDTVTLSCTSASFADRNVGIAKTVSVGGIAIAGADAGNYTLLYTSASTAANITAKNLTISGAVANNRTYDASTAATVNFGSAGLAGVVSGDTVSINSSSYIASFADKTVGIAKAVTVSGVTLSGADAGNYTVSQSGGLTATIAAKNLTISGAVATNRVYDATTTATVNFGGASLVGKMGGDTVTINSSSYSASFAGKVIGNGKAVTVSGVTLSGADAANYTVSQPAGLTANITALHVTGTFTAANKIYDGNTSATVKSRSLVGAIGGDVVSLSGGTATFNNKNVGNNKTVTLTGATLAGSDAGNYVLDSVATTTANITAAAVHITGTFTAASKTYDGTAAATVTGTGLVGVMGSDVVNLSGGTATFADKNVGNNKTVTLTGATLAGADASNYILDSVATTTANITALHITGTFTAADKGYDATTTATVTGRSLVGALGGDVVSLSGGTATFADKNVGNSKTVTLTGATLAGAGAGNYVLDSVATTTATISKVGLDVYAVADSRTYDGTTASGGTPTVSGLKGSDTVTGRSQVFVSRNVLGAGLSTLQVSAYTVNDGNLGGNYTVSAHTATGTITKAALDISAVSDSKPYDGTTASSGTPTVSGLKGSDTVTGRTQAFASKNVMGAGLSTLQVSAYIVNDGNAGGNYTVTTHTAGGTITAKALTVSGITAADKVYDGGTTATVDFGGASLVSVANGDVVTINSSAYSAAFAGRSIGPSKTVTVSGVTLSGADAGNYTLTQPTTTASITPAGLTVSGITAADKVYDGGATATLNVAGAGLVGKQSGDTVSLNTGSAAGAFADKGVGANKLVTVSGLTIGGADAGNYTLSQPTTTANITQATLMVDAVPVYKTYGESDPTFGFELSGFVNAEDATSAGVVGAPHFTREAGEDSGVYALTVADTGTLAAANYRFETGAPAVLIIGIEITVTAPAGGDTVTRGVATTISWEVDASLPGGVFGVWAVD